jgi:hypothetical protein
MVGVCNISGNVYKMAENLKERDYLGDLRVDVRTNFMELRLP